MSEIIQSQEYDLFSFKSENRDIHQKHLKVLINSIRQYGFFKTFPIHVTKNFEIIDGQHRFLASKECNVPFYYIVDDLISENKMAIINSTQKTWRVDDFVHFYALQGNKSYALFLKFYNEISPLYEWITLPILITWYQAFTTLKQEKGLTEIRQGTWEFYPSSEFRKAFCDGIDILLKMRAENPYLKKISTSRSFGCALFMLLAFKNFDLKSFLTKIHKLKDFIGHCHNAIEYLKGIIEFYNCGKNMANRLAVISKSNGVKIVKGE